MQGIERKKTEDILVEAGLLSSEKLKEIKRIELKTGVKLEKILLSEEVIKYKEILKMSAKKIGVEFVDLENAYVNNDAISVINPQIAAKYSVFPFDIKNNLLFLAMQNPDDIFLIDEIKVFTQMEIKPFLADSRLLSKAIKHFYKSENLSIQDKIEYKAHSEGIQHFDKEAIESVSTVDELLRRIVIKALKINCVDIHIDSINRNLRIRYRVDGTLIEEGIRYSVGYEEFTAKVKVMAGLLACDMNISQKGSIKYKINGTEKVNIEVFALHVIDGEKLLLKLQSSKCCFRLEEIGMSEKEQKQIRDMLEKRSGMVIVAGLSGNGKTTTCYSMIKEIMSEELNIITIEKKILQKIEGISQVQLQGKKDSFLIEVVDSIIMHDPDVVVADIDINATSKVDISILKQLMNAALGGKLVIVTMNFSSSFETISGIISLGFEKYTVAASIEGIIAQHLVRKKCTACERKKGSKHCLDKLHKMDKSVDVKVKCEICSDVGYKGKVGIFEVFTMNKEYRKLITRDNNLELIESRIGSEYSSFRNNCIRLINDNVTSVEEIIRIGIGKDVLNF